MKRVKVFLAVVVVVLVCLSVFISAGWFTTPQPNREFYVGAEYAYGSNPQEVKALVDKVKGYTNLLVLGSSDLTFNESALTESCNYIADAGMHFIIMFTDITKYAYNTSVWTSDAQEKYGSLLLGIYRYDEPGGIQLDQPASRNYSIMVPHADNYSDAASKYTNYMYYHVDYYHLYFDNISVVTADYGLYWYDYKASYDTILAEFVWNQSRLTPIALCRGAAETQGKDWGIIVTWKYDQAPYLESADELYSDLRLAYEAGAKYAVVFSYPQLDSYGTLTQEHLDAIQRFWDSIQNNPQSFGENKAEAVYVLPKDYGFGFRRADDTIWGVFPADELSTKIWADVNLLESRYGSRFNIIYDDGLDYAKINQTYKEVFFWNQTIT
ncbi:MAG: hypothetical protein ACQCN3_01275 [Candidatus Bathyarchaeia archaeon]